jgi:hypothetical protein
MACERTRACTSEAERDWPESAAARLSRVLAASVSRSSLLKSSHQARSSASSATSFSTARAYRLASYCRNAGSLQPAHQLVGQFDVQCHPATPTKRPASDPRSISQAGPLLTTHVIVSVEAPRCRSGARGLRHVPSVMMMMSPPPGEVIIHHRLLATREPVSPTPSTQYPTPITHFAFLLRPGKGAPFAETQVRPKRSQMCWASVDLTRRRAPRLLITDH